MESKIPIKLSLEYSYFFWRFLIVLLFLSSCGDYENPVKESKRWDDAPYSQLLFNPSRKYISNNENISVQVNGLQSLYQCAYINKLHIENKGDNQYALDIQLIWPLEFYDCPLAPAEGLDTLVSMNFMDAHNPLEKIFLLNSSGEVTDSSRFAPFPHLTDEKKWADLDSAKSLDSLVDAYILADSLAMDCGDSLSYALYCKPDSQSLKLMYGYTRGWSQSGCIGQYQASLMDIKPWVQALDTSLDCSDYSMEN